MSPSLPHSGIAPSPSRQPPPRPPHLVHAGAVTGAVWASGFATQYVAARLAYHPHLGPWLYRASSSARERFGIAIPLCLVSAGLALLTRRWRWAVIPLVLAAVTAAIARNAPLVRTRSHLCLVSSVPHCLCVSTALRRRLGHFRDRDGRGDRR